MPDLNRNITVTLSNYHAVKDDAYSLTLPVSDEELQRFLTETKLVTPKCEDYFISSYENKPFDTPVLCRYTSLNDLNLLAKQLEGLDDETFAHARTLINDRICVPETLSGLMHIIEHADEYYEYTHAPLDKPYVMTLWPDNKPYKNLDERLGRALTSKGELEKLSQEELEHYFDKFKYFRSRVDWSQIALGDNGFVCLGDTKLEKKIVSTEELVEKAGYDPEVHGPIPTKKITKELQAYNVDTSGLFLGKALPATYLLLQNLNDNQKDALHLYGSHVYKNKKHRFWEWAAVVAQIDQVHYYPYLTGEHAPKDARDNAACVLAPEDFWHEAAANGRITFYENFDYEHYGADQAKNYFVTDRGYAKISDVPPVNYKDFDEQKLKDTIARRWDEAHPEKVDARKYQARRQTKAVSPEKDMMAALAAQRLLADTVKHEPVTQRQTR